MRRLHGGRCARPPAHTRRRLAPFINYVVQQLEPRVLLTAITPQLSVTGIDPGHRVEFRQAASPFMLNSVGDAEMLFTGAIPGNVAGTDNGINVINYTDSAT